MKILFRKTAKFIKSSFLPILGLSIAISTTFLILWIVSFEVSFDDIHENRKNIYRVTMQLLTSESEDHYAATGGLLGRDLQEKYPNIGEFVSFRMWDGPGNILVDRNKFENEKILGVNNEVFNVFSYELIEGGQNALSEINSIVLTESLARKIFGNKPAINNRIDLDGEQYTVTGIMKDLPGNSDLQFDALTSIEIAEPEDGILQSYFNMDHYTYVMPGGLNQTDQLNDILSRFSEEYLNAMLVEVGQEFSVNFVATPLDKLHFSEALMMDTPKENINNIYILFGLAMLLLVIGTANFLNIIISKSYKKATKIAMQQVLGAGRRHIRLTFIKESILMVSVAIVLSLLTVYLCITNIEMLSEVRFSIDRTKGLVFFLIIFFLLVFIGSIGGLVPAFQMHKANVASLLRKKAKLISHKSWNQRTVLFLQFGISFALIAGTIELYRQFSYFSNQNLGFNDKNVLVVNVPSDENLNGKMNVFKQGLLSQAQFSKVAFSRAVPGDGNSQELFQFSLGGESAEVVYNYEKVDEHYFDILEVPIAEGRIFDRNYDENSLLVNKKFAEQHTAADLFDAQLTLDTTKQIVGIVNDYHQLSFHNPIEPVVYGKLDPENDRINRVMIKASSDDLPLVRQEWDKLGLSESFDNYFLDAHFKNQYTKEESLIYLFTICALISIILCCFGLYGLVAVMMRNRKRELAIRQVLGGSFKTNFYLLSRSYLIIVGLVSLVILPIVYYLSNKWREGFAYSIGDSPLSYLISIVIMILLVVGIVLYHLKSFEKISVTKLIKPE